MKVSVSALTRFHIFDQALQLYKHNMLQELITAYPKSSLRNFSLLKNNVISFPSYALGLKFLPILDLMYLGRLSRQLNKSIIEGFSQTVARYRSHDSDVIIGLSAFMLDVIESSSKSHGKIIVDHGSLHEGVERDIMLEECDKYGFKPFGVWQHQWIIDRQIQEFKRADFVFSCSNLAKETLIAKGVNSEKIFVNQLGVDLRAFSRLDNRKVNRPFRILMVGALNPRKGVQYLLKAFLCLPKNTELWLVGALPTDEKLKDTLNSAIRQTKRIRLFGSIPQTNLPWIYNQCDAFCLPSLADGWGMVVSQAAASGLPIIISEMTGAKELINNGVNGFVVPSRSSEELVIRLMELINNPEMAISMGREAARIVEKGWTWDDYGLRLYNWIDQMK